MTQDVGAHWSADVGFVGDALDNPLNGSNTNPKVVVKCKVSIDQWLGSGDRGRILRFDRVPYGPPLP